MLRCIKCREFVNDPRHSQSIEQGFETVVDVATMRHESARRFGAKEEYFKLCDELKLCAYQRCESKMLQTADNAWLNGLLLGK